MIGATVAPLVPARPSGRAPEALRDRGGAALEPAGDSRRVDRDPDSVMPWCGSSSRGSTRRTWWWRAGHGGRPTRAAEIADGGGQGPVRPRSRRVRIAGRLEGGALVAPGDGREVTPPWPTYPGRFAQDVGEVGIRAGDRRAGQRAREIAVLAVGRAALGEVDPPVGGGRNGLQCEFRRWRDDDGQRRFRSGVPRPGVRRPRGAAAGLR